MMAQQVEAIYEHGVLRPLHPLSLRESQRVKLTISEIGTGHSQRDLRIMERARTELAATEEIPSIEEVRQMLGTIPGCISHDVIADRDDS